MLLYLVFPHIDIADTYRQTFQIQVADYTDLALSWLRWLVAGLSPRRPGFAPGSVHMRFVVGKLALSQHLGV
jgi:hypothetical protein